MNNNQPPARGEPPAERSPTLRHSHELLQGARELHILHEGTRYILRLTRFNKLILTK